MNIEKLEKRLQSLATNPKGETFIYELLATYGVAKAGITRLQRGDYNLSKNKGEVLWKKKVFFRKEYNQDLHVLIDTLKNDSVITRQQPRFIIVTDFNNFLALDTKTDDTLDIPIGKLAGYYDFFLPWAGREKTQQISETLADIKAAERMGQLYDPDKMPDGLRLAHHEMDLAVERCYRSRPFTSDEERLEYLFTLYEKMIAAEKNK